MKLRRTKQRVSVFLDHPVKSEHRRHTANNKRQANVKCHTQSTRWTDRRTKRGVPSSVRPFVRSCLCPLCPSWASILLGERTAMLHRKLRVDKIRDQPLNTRNVVRKFIKIIATRCHILRLKCTKFDSRRLSVRAFFS